MDVRRLARASKALGVTVTFVALNDLDGTRAHPRRHQHSRIAGRKKRDAAGRLGADSVWIRIDALLCSRRLTVEPAPSGFVTFRDAMWWALHHCGLRRSPPGDSCRATRSGVPHDRWCRPHRHACRHSGLVLLGRHGGEDVASTPVDQVTDAMGTISVQQQLLSEVKSMRAEIAEIRRSVGG